MRRLPCAGAVVAAALALLPHDAAADSASGGLTYAVRSVATSSAGVSSVSELLVLQQNENRATVTVSDTSGAALTLPTQVMADGEIAANSGDPAVACYNNAMTLLASGDRSHASGAVFVSFGSSVVRIAVPLREVQDTGGIQAFSGTGSVRFAIDGPAAQVPVRIESAASLLAAGNQLEQATIETHTLIGNSAELTGRNVCTLARMGRPGTAPAIAASLT